MAVEQVLPQRYVDKAKLGNFWSTHPDFKGEPCEMEVSLVAI